MTKTFTQDDVIRYLYGEIPKKEKARFEEAMICNSTLLNLFHELSSAKDHLNQALIEPSEEVTRRIFEFSKSCDLDSVKK